MEISQFEIPAVKAVMSRDLSCLYKLLMFILVLQEVTMHHFLIYNLITFLLHHSYLPANLHMEWSAAS